jgi:hypothetical protein
MSKATLGVMVMSVAVLAAAGARPNGGEEAARAKIEGTWELIHEGQNLRQVKVINQDHFIWVAYDLESKVSLFSAGGPYTFKDGTYKEQVEFGRFGSPELQKTVGKEQEFKVEFDGNTLTQTGTLTSAHPIREIWKRVK